MGLLGPPSILIPPNFGEVDGEGLEEPGLEEEGLKLTEAGVEAGGANPALGMGGVEPHLEGRGPALEVELAVFLRSPNPPNLFFAVAEKEDRSGLGRRLSILRRI